MRENPRMRNLRRVMSLVGCGVLLGVTLTVVTPTPPSAKAATCPLITDRKGDARNQVGTDDSLDILSADLVSDAKTVTATIRLKALSAVSPGAPQARNYYLLFNTTKPSAQMFLNATVFSGGVVRYAWGTVGPFDPAGLIILYDNGNYGVTQPATGAFDLTKNEIRISANVADMAAKGNVKPGAEWKRISATSWYQITTFIFEADVAAAPRPYVAGTPGCIKPGA